MPTGMIRSLSRDDQLNNVDKETLTIKKKSAFYGWK